MTDISTFPTATSRIKYYGTNSLSFEAAEAITAGMVVELDDDGKLIAGNSGDTKVPIGVADADIASGAWGTVHCAGTVCYVANELTDAAIGEGVTLKISDTDGAVMAMAGGADLDEYCLGLAITDITADGWGLCVIMPYINTTA